VRARGETAPSCLRARRAGLRIIIIIIIFVKRAAACCVQGDLPATTLTPYTGIWFLK